VAVNTIDPILSSLHTFFFFTIITIDLFDPDFWAGAAVIFVSGILVFFFYTFLKPIFAFFEKSTIPVTKKGPSPFERLIGCTTRFIMILFVLSAAILLFFFTAP
jgi:hypothetical protein